MKSRMRTKTKTLKAAAARLLESIPRAAYKCDLARRSEATRRKGSLRRGYDKPSISSRHGAELDFDSCVGTKKLSARSPLPLPTTHRSARSPARWVRRGARRGRLGRSFFAAVVPRAGARFRRRAARASRAGAPSPAFSALASNVSEVPIASSSPGMAHCSTDPATGLPHDPDEPGPRAARRGAKGGVDGPGGRRRGGAVRRALGRGNVLVFCPTIKDAREVALAFSTPSATRALGPGAAAVPDPRGLRRPRADARRAAAPGARRAR